MTSVTSAFPPNVISPPAEIAPLAVASPSNEIAPLWEVTPATSAVPPNVISPLAEIAPVAEVVPVTEIIPLDESALFTARFPLMDKFAQFPETFICAEEVSVTEPALIPFSPRIIFPVKVPFNEISLPVPFAIVVFFKTFNSEETKSPEIPSEKIKFS